MFGQTEGETRELAVEQLPVILHQFRLPNRTACRLGYRFLIAGKGSKRGELRCPAIETHLWMSPRNVMGKVDNVIVITVCHALCPPICRLRSLAVDPSSKFRPRSRAFFPNLFLMLMIVSCILRSRVSSVSSSFLRFLTAS